MQPATESGDVFSLAATLYALLAGSPPRCCRRRTQHRFEQMVEVAKRPIAPIPGVNWYLMDVLMTALSNDPAARPTAARFRDQLANVPAPPRTRLHTVRNVRRFAVVRCIGAKTVAVHATRDSRCGRRGTTTQRARHSGLGRGLGYRDRVRDHGLADQRARFVGCSCRDHATNQQRVRGAPPGRPPRVPRRLRPHPDPLIRVPSRFSPNARRRFAPATGSSSRPRWASVTCRSTCRAQIDANSGKINLEEKKRILNPLQASPGRTTSGATRTRPRRTPTTAIPVRKCRMRPSKSPPS